MQTSYHNARGGLLCKAHRMHGCTWYQILTLVSVQSDFKNRLFLNKKTYKRS